MADEPTPAWRFEVHVSWPVTAAAATLALILICGLVADPILTLVTVLTLTLAALGRSESM